MHDDAGRPRHAGDRFPEGEISAWEAVGNVIRDFARFPLTAFRVSLVAAVYAAVSVREMGEGRVALGFALCVAGLLTLGLFVVDLARLHRIRRNAWSRWAVRSWWILSLAPFVVVLVR